MLLAPLLLRYLWIFPLIGIAAVYLMTLSPEIGPHDSPELSLAARTLGVPHPPGYPLLIIIGYLFSHLPFGHIGWRLNLASAVLGVATLAVLYFLLLRLTKNAIASLVGVLFLAFAKTFWLQSLIFEVFTLNTLFIALILLFLSFWEERRKAAYLLAAVFVFGLGMTHQYTILLLLPVLIFFTWYTDQKIFRNVKFLSIAAGVFLLGLTPYVLLPLRAHAENAFVWGEPGTLLGFLRILVRSGYTDTAQDWIGSGHLRVWDWVKAISYREWTILGLFFALIGAWSSRKTHPGWWILIFAGALLEGPLFAFLYNIDPKNAVAIATEQRFYLPSLLLLSLWIAFGAAFLIERIQLRTRWANGIALIGLVPLIVNFSFADRSAFFHSHDIAYNMLSQLPEHAVLYVRSDVPLFSLWYLQDIEHVRSDVVIIAGTDYAQPNWYFRKIKKRFPDADKPIEELAAKYQVYLDRAARDTRPALWDRLEPVGALFRFHSDQDWLRSWGPDTGERAFAAYQMRGPYIVTAGMDAYVTELIDLYALAHADLSTLLLAHGDTERAREEAREALRLHPKYRPLLLTLAQVAKAQGKTQEVQSIVADLLAANQNDQDAKLLLEGLPKAP